MSTQEVANRLVELCRQGKFSEAQEALYAENAVSLEPGFPKAEGREALREKGRQFEGMVEEMYGAEVSDPLVANDFFSVVMTIDVKYKGEERRDDSEICVYQVKDGKVVLEQFFYNTDQ